MHEMKDSGIEWIGKIPSNWEIIRVKDKYSFDTGFTPDTKHSEYYSDDNGYEWVTISDMNDGKIDTPTKSTISKDYVRQNHKVQYPKNCLLYSFKLSVGQTAMTDRPLFTNEAIACFYPTEKSNLRFLKYSSSLIEYNANTNIYGAKILNQQLINNAYIPYPPLSVQEQIANFLDQKCSKIDNLFSNIEEQIKTLEEYKKAIIVEAVTKGLNPDVTMKDSGIDWIGMIPKEWDKNKVRYIFSIIGGNGFPIELQGKDSGKYPFCKCSDINGKQMYVAMAANYVDEQDVRENKFNIIPVNSLIFAKIGEALKKNHRKLNAIECCIDNNTQALVIIDKKYDCRYAYYVFTNIDMYEFDNGGPVPSINNNKLKDLYIPTPTLSEQQLIADYLDEKCAEIDELINTKKEQLKVLEDYKKSVIYEYVTGKKEVL